MTKLAGYLLVVTGVVHLLYGLWLFRDPLAGIAADGFSAALGQKPDRRLAFWFLFAGPMIWIVGQLVLWTEARGLRPPGWLGWQLLSLSLVGLALKPRSGFWLALVPAALLVLGERL